MSLKRSHTSTRSPSSGGSDGGQKLGRQEFYDELKKHAQTGQVFTPVDVAMAIGAGEAAVSRALLGLAAEGYVEKVDAGRYRSTPFQEVPQAEFLKALSRASKTDSTRQRDLSEIARLKSNNDVMRAKLLSALAERDHYLAVLRQHGIDPGPAPAPARAEGQASAPAPQAAGDAAPVPAPAEPPAVAAAAPPTDETSSVPDPAPAPNPVAAPATEGEEPPPPPASEQPSG